MDANGRRSQHRSAARRTATVVAVPLRVLERLLSAGWVERPVADAVPGTADETLRSHEVGHVTPTMAAFAPVHGPASRARRRVPVRGAFLAAALTALVAVAPAAAQRPPQQAPEHAPPREAIRARDAVAWRATEERRADAREAQRRELDRRPGRIDHRFDARGVVAAPTAIRGEVPEPRHRVIIYRAEPGDALWTVARKFGISPMTVWWANRLLDKDTLKIGQRMRILPTSGIEHLVREGDTLDAIARGYRADAEVIAEYNGLVGGVVVIGQRLIIPGGHGAPYAPVTEVSRQTTVPRLRPGQAGFAAVDRPAVAGPVAVPTAPGPTVGGGKTTLGVDWPQPDDASAGPGGHPGHDGSLGHDGSHGGPSVGPGAGGPVYWDGWGESAFWDTITIPPGGGRDSPPDDGRSIVFIDEHGRPVPASRAGTDAPGDDGSQFVFVVRPPQRPDPAPGGRPGGGSGPGGDGPDGDAPDRAPVIVIPDDAPRTGGRYPLPDPDWPDGGPDPGPSHGVWIDPDDRRLRLTPERALEERALFWPVYGGGRVSQHYHDEHLGLDIAAPQGTPILAAHEGIVVYRGWRDARGANQVWIKHGDRIWTMYLHLHSFAVRRGEWVEQGQVIGYMGSTGYSTGPHLHFNVVTGAAPAIGTGDRRDPLPYLWRPR